MTNSNSAAANLATSTGTRLYGALCVQRGTPMLQSYASARTIAEQTTTDEYNPNTEDGYQRSLVTSRIAQTAVYYDAKHGRMPNPLLLSIREEDFSGVRVEVTGGDNEQRGYTAAIEDEGNWMARASSSSATSWSCGCTTASTAKLASNGSWRSRRASRTSGAHQPHPRPE